ncbi:hypothetical protein CVT25_010176 [Psilocybe cyanescens]|uniref:Uncharacterized protein n=1 Tax=Psilocybe cyanescens TaxID=93625 RepID=A0A409X2S6_PSICY|nr:hypothetical protein CVT25_010176 [Psilocybe cyanescens]
MYPHLAPSIAANMKSRYSVISELDASNYLTNIGILVFACDTFNEIKTQHRLRSYIPIGWPAEDSLDSLVQKSSGQFIYASTVVKYVASPRHRPTHHLEVVLGIQLPKAGDSPFAELDALYRHILMGIADVDLILQIIGFVVLHPPNYYNSVTFMEAFLLLAPGDVELLMQNLGSLISIIGFVVLHPPNYYNSVTFMEAFLLLAPGDVELLMQNLGSLISVEIHPYHAEVLTVCLLHASLKDYLLDQ